MVLTAQWSCWSYMREEGDILYCFKSVGMMSDAVVAIMLPSFTSIWSSITIGTGETKGKSKCTIDAIGAIGDQNGNRTLATFLKIIRWEGVKWIELKCNLFLIRELTVGNCARSSFYCKLDIDIFLWRTKLDVNDSEQTIQSSSHELWQWTSAWRFVIFWQQGKGVQLLWFQNGEIQL